MAGPASPSEGPTFAPPPLPPGWIAQWDGSSKKYYYVQLSTGVSQWETPTEAAPVGGTPAATLDHPYGVPGADRKPEVITHPDGSQTVKHPDGRLEPVLPPEDGARAGMNGAATGERGLGSFLSSVQHASSSPLGQMLGGLAHSGGGGGGGSSGIGGKLASQLASNLFSGGGNSKPRPPQNYHGGQTAQPAHTGGLAGSVIGGVSSFLGGNQHTSNQNFGYSNNPSQSAGYSGQAPPASYQPPSSSGYAGQQGTVPAYSSQSSTPSYQQPANPPQYSHNNAASSYSQPASGLSYPQTGAAPSYHGLGSTPSYQQQPQQPPRPSYQTSTTSYHTPPPHQPSAPSYGQQGSGQPPYGSSVGQAQYGQQAHIPNLPPTAQGSYGSPAPSQSGFAQSQQQQQPQQQQHPPSSYANHKQAQQSPYAPSQSQYSNSGSYHPPYANMTPPPSAASASQYSSQPSYGQQQGYGDPRY